METYTQREMRKLQAKMDATEGRNYENTNASDEEESSKEEKEEVAEE